MKRYNDKGYYAPCLEDAPLTLEAATGPTGPPTSSTVVGPNRKVRFTSDNESIKITKSKVQGTANVNLKIPDYFTLLNLFPNTIPVPVDETVTTEIDFYEKFQESPYVNIEDNCIIFFSGFTNPFNYRLGGSIDVELISSNAEPVSSAFLTVEITLYDVDKDEVLAILSPSRDIKVPPTPDPPTPRNYIQYVTFSISTLVPVPLIEMPKTTKIVITLTSNGFYKTADFSIQNGNIFITSSG